MTDYQKPKIVVSIETKSQLDELGDRSDTYDSIIIMLLKCYRKHEEGAPQIMLTSKKIKNKWRKNNENK